MGCRSQEGSTEEAGAEPGLRGQRIHATQASYQCSFQPACSLQGLHWLRCPCFQFAGPKELSGHCHQLLSHRLVQSVVKASPLPSQQPCWLTLRHSQVLLCQGLSGHTVTEETRRPRRQKAKAKSTELRFSPPGFRIQLEFQAFLLIPIKQEPKLLIMQRAHFQTCIQVAGQSLHGQAL